MRVRRRLPGNPYLISLEFLADWGWIDGERIAGLAGTDGNVDFEEVEARKLPLLYEAAGNFLDRGPQRSEAGRAVEAVRGVLPGAGELARTTMRFYAELRRQSKHRRMDGVAGAAAPARPGCAG